MESQEALIAEAAVIAGNCGSPSEFEILFSLAASGNIAGAHTMEELSEANEEVFLKCPLAFLRALKVSSEVTRNSVLDYFGIRHSPSELGKELRKWEGHEEVGELVHSHFSAFLEAEVEK